MAEAGPGVAEICQGARGRYINVARASLTELSYLLRFARDRGLLLQLDFVCLDDLWNRVGQLTWGMLRAWATDPFLRTPYPAPLRPRASYATA